MLSSSVTGVLRSELLSEQILSEWSTSLQTPEMNSPFHSAANVQVSTCSQDPFAVVWIVF